MDQARVHPDEITETQFLREHAWVVLNAGFREAVVRPRFNYISLCFCDWESAGSIVSAGPVCIATAFPSFRNQRKLQAIYRTAEIIDRVGFPNFFERVRDEPARTLDELPHIGIVTALHLAKNLGFDVPKPDRHLLRLAARFRYSSVNDLCSDLAEMTGDQISIVDLVLWRFEERSARGAVRSGQPNRRFWSRKPATSLHQP